MIDYVQKFTSSGFIDKPQLVTVPRNFPFFIAVSKVALKASAIGPNNSLNLRIGIGCDVSKERANLIASYEAIERYSLQYHDSFGNVKTPAHTTSTDKERTSNIENLMLGAPNTANEVTSKGAAFRNTFELAAIYAIFELTEHSLIDAYKNGELKFSNFNEPLSDEIHSISKWAKALLRKFEFRIGCLPSVCWVAMTQFSDLDGGRTTEGSACSIDPNVAVLKAMKEAVLSWRNMVQLEFNCKEIDSFYKEDAELFMRYRGATSKNNFHLPADEIENLETFELPKIEDMMLSLKNFTGNDISVFDLSDPELKAPVAKAIFL